MHPRSCFPGFWPDRRAGYLFQDYHWAQFDSVVLHARDGKYFLWFTLCELVVCLSSYSIFFRNHCSCVSILQMIASRDASLYRGGSCTAIPMPPPRIGPGGGSFSEQSNRLRGTAHGPTIDAIGIAHLLGRRRRPCPAASASEPAVQRSSVTSPPPFPEQAQPLLESRPPLAARVHGRGGGRVRRAAR